MTHGSRIEGSDITLSDQCAAQHLSTNMPYSGLRPTTQSNFDANTNRLVESAGQVGYDATGNQTTHGGWTLAYDAEGRIKAATPSSGNAATYEYDGDGRRVKKTVGSTATWFVYDVTGQLAAEYTVAGPTGNAETHYLTTDHLGSTRLVTDQAGAVVSRHDYFPFGEELPANLGGRSTSLGYLANANLTHRFTGKERDTETTLDFFGARYLSSAQGRFASPDPLLNSGRPWQPQSWNRYAYTLNNPLKYVDPDGLWEWEAGACDEQCQANRKRFRSAVELIRKAADKNPSLFTVVKAIGKENEKTRLSVRFGSLEGNVGATYNPKTGMMTVDFARSDAIFDSRPDLESLGFSREVENSSSILHEGTHHADRLAGYDFGISSGGRNQAGDLQRLYNAESKAYRNQILLHRTTDTRPLTFRELWNSSWSTVDQHTIDSAVGRKAQQSVDYVRKELGIK
jgi:RHS repeat-associated protein